MHDNMQFLAYVNKHLGCMFQEIEEFVKTDPYTKAGLISSWYASLSIFQLPLRPFCDA